MPKLLIIADDLTGALDTGVKFSEAGLSTTVSTDCDETVIAEKADVVVLCAATRHLAAEDAYRMIRKIVERNAGQFPIIMKKTDSGLRGNIGAELQAVLDGARANTLAFLPALPEMGRTTLDGVQYIDGVPVNRSVFGRDPFEPVVDDDIPSLLRRQCKADVKVIRRGAVLEAKDQTVGSEIFVYDAQTAEDMRVSVSEITRRGEVRLLAGCAGLAQALAGEMASAMKTRKNLDSDKPLLVVCGSVNQISTAQLDYAEKNGHPRFHLPAKFLLGEEALDTPEDSVILKKLLKACETERLVLVDTASSKGKMMLEESKEQSLEVTRQRISRKLGRMVKALLDHGLDRRVMIIGGDTLSELMGAVGCTKLSPVREPDRGVVLSSLQYNDHSYQILSKSGGFGGEDLLLRI